MGCVCSNSSRSIDRTVWQLFRKLGELSQFPIKKFDFLQKNLFENGSKLHIFTVDSKPLEMIGIFMDTFIAVSGLINVVLLNPINNFNTILNFTLNFRL